MAKLYVLISGLVLVALPKQRGDAAKILLARNDEFDALHGDEVHQAIVKFKSRHFCFEKCIPVSLGPARWTLEGEDISFLIDGGEPCGWVKIFNREYFEFWERVIGKGLAKVRPECLGEKAHKECLISGRPGLSGRVILRGGILRPVNIINAHQVTCRGFGEVWGFRSRHNPSVTSDVYVDLFNAILFEADVQYPEQLRLRIGETMIPLDKEDVEFIVKCEEEKQAEQPDQLAPEEPEQIEQFLVTIENLSEKSKDIRIVDEHFDRLYDLLEKNIGERYVPYRKIFEDDPDSGENPPGRQCIPGAGQ